MTDEAKQSHAVATIMRALNWAYDKATSDIPGLGSAASLAESHLKKCGGDREKAVDDLVAWQVGYAGAAGFATNLGGIMTLPVAIPANVSSVLFIQLRMIAAVAHVYGHDVKDERVRTLAYMCLTGSSAAAVLQEFGVKLGTKLSMQAISKIPGTLFIQINKAVGFRLITKAGNAGLVNLTKVVPFIGGLVGGAWDAGVTRGIAAVAKEAFRSSDDEASPSVVEEPFKPPVDDASNGAGPFGGREFGRRVVELEGEAVSPALPGADGEGTSAPPARHESAASEPSPVATHGRADDLSRGEPVPPGMPSPAHAVAKDDKQ